MTQGVADNFGHTNQDNINELTMDECIILKLLINELRSIRMIFEACFKIFGSDLIVIFNMVVMSRLH